MEQYKQRKKETKKKKLKKAIDAATKAYLEENPNLSWDIKQNIFDIKLYSKKKFHKLKKYLTLIEEDEEQKGENDIQSFIESEADEIEIYKKELKNKKCENKNLLGNKRKLIKEDSEENIMNIKRRNNLTMSEEEDSFDSRSSYTKINDKNKIYNRELKKFADELFRINIEIKRKNNINNIINILDNIENIINKYNFEYEFNATKDLLIILNSYTHYNNEIIMNKSLSLHKELVSKYLEDIFNYDLINELKIANNQEINNILGKDINLLEEIITTIDKIKIEKEKKSLLSIKDKNKLISENDDLKDLDIIIIKKEIENSENKNNENIIYNNENEINNNNSEEEEKTINNNKLKEEKENKITDENSNKMNFNNNEPFLKDILNTPNYFSKKIEGQLYPDNFFKDIYLKSNINSRTELLRKKMCLQLYNILKLVLPYCQEDIFKKNIIFLEYLARKNDPLFGNKYMAIINMIYNKIKLEAVKIKNKNNK